MVGPTTTQACLVLLVIILWTGFQTLEKVLSSVTLCLVYSESSFLCAMGLVAGMRFACTIKVDILDWYLLEYGSSY